MEFFRNRNEYKGTWVYCSNRRIAANILKCTQLEVIKVAIKERSLTKMERESRDKALAYAKMFDEPDF